jgi:hypothetical protein
VCAAFGCRPTPTGREANVEEDDSEVVEHKKKHKVVDEDEEEDDSEVVEHKKKHKVVDEGDPEVKKKHTLEIEGHHAKKHSQPSVTIETAPHPQAKTRHDIHSKIHVHGMRHDNE